MAPPRIISFPRHPIEGLPLQKARPFNAPPGKTPQDLFTHDISEDTAFRCIGQPDRFVRRNADCEMLIYVDGSCLDQNTKVDVGANRWSAPAESSSSTNTGLSPENAIQNSSNALQNSIDLKQASIDPRPRRAGCAWVFKPAPYPLDQSSVHIRLETEGVDGVEYPQTSNRAELRAPLGALEFRAWYGEGWDRFIVATDSEYLVSGITSWIEKWACNGWKTSAGKSVQNQDLWKALLAKVNDLGEKGTETVFWKIPREWNAEADAAAKRGAAQKSVRKHTRIIGALM